MSFCVFGWQWSRGHPYGLLNESWGQIFNERPIWPSALIQESGARGAAGGGAGKNRAAAWRKGGESRAREAAREENWMKLISRRTDWNLREY